MHKVWVAVAKHRFQQGQELEAEAILLSGLAAGFSAAQLYDRLLIERVTDEAAARAMYTTRGEPRKTALLLFTCYIR